MRQSVPEQNVILKTIDRDYAWSIICLGFAVVILAFAPILTRLSENSELGPYGTVFNRFSIASLLLILGNGVKAFWRNAKNLFSNEPQNYSSNQVKQVYLVEDYFYLILVGTFVASCQIFWAWSLIETSVANSNLLHNTTPLFTTLAAWLFLNQSFSHRFLVGMALAIAGTLIIGIQDFQFSSETLMGDCLALISAVFYAGCLLVIEDLRKKFNTLTILQWVCGCCSLILLPCTLFFEDHLFPISFSGWFAVSGLALFCTIFGQLALFFPLKKLSSSFVSIVMLLEPVIAAFLAWLFFAEQLSILNGLTFALILYGIYLSDH